MLDAILFVQLGSPEDATPKSVEKYLLEFLGDRHTLGNPPFFWNWLLHHIIAPKRSVKSAEKYRVMLETADLGEMPLVHYTRKFAEGIAAEVGSQIPVRYAFEFGTKPSISDALKELANMGKKTVRVIPLFPQRSLVTTVAVHDLAAEAFQKFPQLQMQFVDGFPQSKVWLEETLNLVRNAWDGIRPIVFSFHGTPESWAVHGDPYSKDCEAAFVWFQKKILESSPNAKIYHTYQSRFGHGKWLGPFTSTVVKELGEAHQDVLIVLPSFTADNLESLYEVDVELKEIFRNAGGKDFVRVACLNDDERWVKRFAEEVVRDDLETIA